jgi:hypothetical protein
MIRCWATTLLVKVLRSVSSTCWISFSCIFCSLFGVTFFSFDVVLCSFGYLLHWSGWLLCQWFIKMASFLSVMECRDKHLLVRIKHLNCRLSEPCLILFLAEEIIASFLPFDVNLIHHEMEVLLESWKDWLYWSKLWKSLLPNKNMH